MNIHLGSGSRALQLAPTLLETAASHIPSTVCDGTRTGIGGRAGGGVLATQTDGIAVVVAIHGVSGTAAADVVDGSSSAHITLEFFVKTEDRTLAAAVDVASTATAGDEV